MTAPLSDTSVRIPQQGQPGRDPSIRRLRSKPSSVQIAFTLIINFMFFLSLIRFGSGVSNIWLGGQNRPGRDSNPVHWVSLENVKKVIDFGLLTLHSIFRSFPAGKPETKMTIKFLIFSVWALFLPFLLYYTFITYKLIPQKLHW